MIDYTLWAPAMAFEITISVDAEANLRALPARDRKILDSAILTRLRDKPTTQTRAIQKLRPNPFAEFDCVSETSGCCIMWKVQRS